MELILLGMGGCTSFDVVEILRKAKQTVNACWVELEAERREEVPQVFTRIQMKFFVEGEGLSKARVARRDIVVRGKVLFCLNDAGGRGSQGVA